MLAAITSVQELALDQKEAENLANAANNVIRHYGIPQIAAETADWINLIMVAGSVYGTRVAAYRIRTTMERANNPPPQPQTRQAQPQPQPQAPRNPPPPPPPTYSPSTVRVQTPGLPPVDITVPDGKPN